MTREELIEELANLHGDICQETNCKVGDCPECIAKRSLPIFARFVGEMEKPSASTLNNWPYSIMPLTTKDAFAIGVKSYESAIKAELEKEG